MTTAEVILWSRLRSKKVNGYKFRRQQPIDDFVADFYCHELKLIIEVDGEIHNLREISEYDHKRENILKSLGYKIIRFENVEIEEKTDDVIDKIKSYIETLSPFLGDP